MTPSIYRPKSQSHNPNETRTPTSTQTSNLISIKFKL